MAQIAKRYLEVKFFDGSKSVTKTYNYINNKQANYTDEINAFRAVNSTLLNNSIDETKSYLVNDYTVNGLLTKSNEPDEKTNDDRGDSGAVAFITYSAKYRESGSETTTKNYGVGKDKVQQNYFNDLNTLTQTLLDDTLVEIRKEAFRKFSDFI